MRRPALALAATLTALVAGALAPAQAITNGEMDGDGHPYVGLMVTKDADETPLNRCSGALVSPTVFVTAGHCTDGAETAHLWFSDERLPLGYQNQKGIASDRVETHPDYVADAFQLHDLAVVLLNDPIELEEYAELPEAGQLDALQKGKKTLFTAVGYGWQKAYPDAASYRNETKAQRMVAHPHLVQINTGYTGDYSMMVSANARTGGTCGGDSGGPVLLGDTDVIAGVVSFGKNVTCGGQSGVYRVDGADDLAWLTDYMATTP